jgi:hypothetical protein
MTALPRVALLAAGTALIALCVFVGGDLSPRMPDLGALMGAALGCTINMVIQMRLKRE